MPKKNKMPNTAQASVIRRCGLDPRLFEIVIDVPGTMIVRNIYTKETKVLEKRANSQTIPN